MPTLLSPAPVALIAAALLAAAGLAVAAPPVSVAGATALVIQPENSYNGYDFTIHAALVRRGLEVTQGQPDDLADAEKLNPYDLVVTNLKRSFTPEQIAGLKAYVAAGGAMYGNWGGPMGCSELLAACGVRNARSVYIHELTLPDSPLTAGIGEQRWVFPDFVGHVRLTEKGHEMVAFDRLDGIEVARDTEGRCLGSLREEGAGRCAVLGFCPSNYRFVADDSRQASVVLDNLLAWLLPRGPRPRPLPQTIRVCLPREARISSVSLDGQRLPNVEANVVGSLQTVTVPVGTLAEGKTARVHVACDLPPVKQHVETWIHDPSASSFASFEPAEAADFLATLHVAVVQPLLRYEGGSSCYLRGIPGDRPRERFTQYQGDLLTDYVKACHARGIKVVGGLYLDWRRFEQHLDDAPAHVAKNDPSPERKLGQPVCPLNGGVWEHNLSIVRTLLDNYPDLDGVILDDNFEFDRDPCYCPDCLARFAAYCERQPGASNPRTEVEAGGALWRAFWKEQVLSFCKRIHDLCAAHGKPVGGWTAQRGPIAFRGVFDFAGDMVYVEPPCSVAPLWPQIGDFPVVTLLWGMNRRPEGMEADVVEAIRAGSDTVGFWIQYARQEGVTDNPWSLGWTSQQGFALTPGSLGAIERAFAGAEQAWRDYYRDNLIQGDARFVITRARLEREGLTVAIQRLDHPASQRVMGPIDLAGLSTTQDPTATREAAVRQGGEAVFGDPVETDAESRAAVYLLGGDERPADNIYGEQPYGDATGRRIAIRYYSSDRKPGGISVLDLGDGSRHDVLVGATPFPAFHAWGEYLYYHETVDDVLWLRRCSFLTLEGEDVAVLPPERGAYSYGTVSPDHRYYAVSVTTPDMPAKVHLLDLVTGEWSILLDRPGYHAKHEQFSMDGRNRVLIQLNQMPDVKQVLLSELEIGGPERPFPADRPHTPRPTGHEAWVGATSRILFSTGHDADSRGNLWTAAVGDPSPTLVYEGPLRFSHVSVSRCGRYWIGDTGEEGIPIYIGSFASGRCRRAVFSRTIYDGKQWAHAHPYLTADNRWLIFTSTRDGHPQVYGARLAEEWLEAL